MLLNKCRRYYIITNVVLILQMGMKILGDSIEKVRSELNKLVRNETILCEGKVLNLSQKLDKLINNHYLNEKPK
jgi:hypothetical protein